MKVYEGANIRNVAVVGHGHAGKTSLVAAAVFTSIWYALGNPYGIDNMYVAAVTPVLVMVIERALSWSKSAIIAETRKQGESHEHHA